MMEITRFLEAEKGAIGKDKIGELKKSDCRQEYRGPVPWLRNALLVHLAGLILMLRLFTADGSHRESEDDAPAHLGGRDVGHGKHRACKPDSWNQLLSNVSFQLGWAVTNDYQCVQWQTGNVQCLAEPLLP